MHQIKKIQESWSVDDVQHLLFCLFACSKPEENWEAYWNNISTEMCYEPQQ